MLILQLLRHPIQVATRQVYCRQHLQRERDARHSVRQDLKELVSHFEPADVTHAFYDVRLQPP